MPRREPTAEGGEQRSVPFGAEEARPERLRAIYLAPDHPHPDGVGRVHREVRRRGLAFETLAVAGDDAQPVVAHLGAADTELNLSARVMSCRPTLSMRPRD